MEVVDTRGLRYTMPIARLAAAMKKAPPGDSFKVISDYPSFELELRMWCDSMGHEVKFLARTGSEITAIVVKKPS